MRPEIQDSAALSRPDVRGIHRYMCYSEVYEEIVTTLSCTASSIYTLAVGKTPYRKRHRYLADRTSRKSSSVDLRIKLMFTAANILGPLTNNFIQRILQPEKRLKRRALQITLQLARRMVRPIKVFLYWLPTLSRAILRVGT